MGRDRCGMGLDVPLETQLDTLAGLCYRGYAGRVMLSHDKGSYMDWWTNAEIDQMLVANPRDLVAGSAAAAGR